MSFAGTGAGRGGGWRVTLAAAAATFLSSWALFPAHDDDRWLWIGAGIIIAVALVGQALRTLHLPRLLIPLIQLGLLGWGFLLAYAPDTLHYGILPSSAAVAEFAARLGDGMAVIVRYSAPLPYDSGAILLTVGGIGLVAVAVDALAATARLVPWAGLPLLLLYSVPATSVPGGQSALAFIPAAIGYIALLLMEGHDRVRHWGGVLGVSSRAAKYDPPTSAFGRTARRVGVTAIGLAVVVPMFTPELPTGLLQYGRGSGIGTGSGQTIRVDNPMVDLRRDLNRPDNFELIEYETTNDDPGYLRIAVLDEFDGEYWRPTSREVPARNQVAKGVPPPVGLSPDVRRTEVETRIEISDALNSKRLPLPYPITAVDVDGDWRYDTETLDVVVGPDGDNDATAGLEYEVTSLEIELSGEALAAAAPPPENIVERYTVLPRDIPDAVIDLARDLVADAETPYARAVALQSWFRSEFTYSIDTAAGHGGSHLIAFLEDKTGYCEQFAATMTIMARGLGIPARVAIGYLPGTFLAGDDWVVRVHDAHAWPELYFQGFGWVRFEPTPAAQTGSAPSWTDLPAAPGEPQPEPSELPTDQGTAPAGGVPPEELEDPALMDPGATAGGGGLGAGDSLPRWPFLIAAGALLVLAIPTLVRSIVRRIRLSRRHPPAKLAEGAWRELADTARDLGLDWDPAATPRSTGAALASRLPQAKHSERSAAEVAKAMDGVVHAVERARYAPAPGDGRGVPELLTTIRRTLRTTVSRPRRLLARLIPLSLLPRPRS